MKTSAMDFALFVDLGDEENSNKSNSHHYHYRPPPITHPLSTSQHDHLNRPK